MYSEIGDTFTSKYERCYEDVKILHLANSHLHNHNNSSLISHCL